MTLDEAPADDRLHALDVLRGLALAGMILVHFHQKMRLEVGGVEDLIGWVVYIFVEQKAWGVFALLFGAGFAILLRRLDARMMPVAAIYGRRLLALAAFGIVADVCFGFHILFAYACWGAVLFAVRKWPTRVLVGIAVLAACARPVVAELSLLGVLPASQMPVASGLQEAVNAAAAQTSYVELFRARLALFIAGFSANWRAVLPDTNLALFIAGLLAVRHGLVDRPLLHAGAVARGMAFGAFSWVAAWTVLPWLSSVVPRAGWPLAEGFGLLQDQWLAFTYAGGVLLLVAARPHVLHRLRPFALAGRMALTNYLFQAAALDALASGYGLSLRLRPALYVVAAAALFAVEAAISAAWLGFFKYGPLEWVWRTITYWRWQPLRWQTANGSLSRLR